MQLKNIFMLSIVFYTTKEVQSSIVMENWKTASSDSFIAQETVPASSEIVCASIATKKRWVNLYKYEDNICHLSDESRIPTSNPEPNSHVKSKHSPHDCLLSNGSVVPNGQQAELSDCATYVCKTSDWVILTEQIDASSCVSPFTSYNGSCYRYVSTSTSWCDARRDCWSMGADLIDVYGMSIATIQDIYSHYGATPFWTGIKKETSEVGFLYMSTPGQPALSDSSSLWRRGQPNNLGNDICAYVLNGNPVLMDAGCSYPRTYICQIP